MTPSLPVLSVHGTSVWTVDSGSEYCITNPDELTEKESEQIVHLDRPIALATGSCATSAETAIHLDPFGSRRKLRALILPDCPPIFSLGELVMDMDFGFVWKAKTLPVITTPEGVSHQLELDSRVPIWPLRRARVLACAGAEEETVAPPSPAVRPKAERNLRCSPRAARSHCRHRNAI